MQEVKFIWDKNKNISNQRRIKSLLKKLKQSFMMKKQECLMILIIQMQKNYSLRLLVVVHAYKESDEIIRIISARKATKTESKSYNKDM